MVLPELLASLKVKLVPGVLDSSGFFVRGGVGENKHTNHPKHFTDVVPLTNRMLSEAEKITFMTTM